MYETLHPGSGIQSDNRVILGHVDNVAKNLRALQLATAFMKTGTK